MDKLRFEGLDSSDSRSVSKDDVGRDPQDNVWSAVVMNVPVKMKNSSAS